MRTNNGDSLGQVLVMGSVSRFPLGPFRTNGWSNFSSTGSLIDGFFA
jgi:hypothetical protein